MLIWFVTCSPNHYDVQDPLTIDSDDEGGSSGEWTSDRGGRVYGGGGTLGGAGTGGIGGGTGASAGATQSGSAGQAAAGAGGLPLGGSPAMGGGGEGGGTAGLGGITGGSAGTGGETSGGAPLSGGSGGAIGGGGLSGAGGATEGGAGGQLGGAGGVAGTSAGQSGALSGGEAGLGAGASGGQAGGGGGNDAGASAEAGTSQGGGAGDGGSTGGGGSGAGAGTDGGSGGASSGGSGMGGAAGGPYSCANTPAPASLITDFDSWTQGADAADLDWTSADYSGGTFIYGGSGVTVTATVNSGAIRVGSTNLSSGQFAGFGVTLLGCYAATSHTGISFSASGTMGSDVRLGVQIQTNSNAPIDPVEQRGACVYASQDSMWDDCRYCELSNVSLGNPVRLAFTGFPSSTATDACKPINSVDATDIIGVQWQFSCTGNNCALDVTLDNLQFY